LLDRKLTELEEDDRTIVNLITDQIEFADVILLNKYDLVDKETLGVIKSTIKRLNPRAEIITTQHSKVSLDKVINTGKFNFEEAEQSAGWLEELKKENHNPETEEYGISSFVFRNNRPFHPERFLKYVEEDFPMSILRSKGLFWLSSRPVQALTWSQAGGSLKADSAGVWWSSMPFDVRISFAGFVHNQKAIEEDWHKTFGDRKNELVFIGQYIDKQKIIAELQSCLCTDEEIALIDWENATEDTWPVEIAIPPHKQELIDF